MFSTIFFFEIKRWLKQPVFYVYCGLYFALALFTSLSNLGFFDAVTATTSVPVYINAPLRIAGFFNSFATLIYFLLPTIIGASVARDYMYNMHTLLFSYPLNKGPYLTAKFLSSLLIVTFIAFLCALGFYLAQLMPGINVHLLGPSNFRAYLEGFLVTIIPNFILFGSIIFALVTFTRSIYVGFIFVLVLLLGQSLLDIATRDVENRYLVAILDPFGFQPIQYYTQYWTVDEQNFNLLPIKGVLLYNRLVWLGFALLVFGLVYYSFSFSQNAFSFKRSSKGARMTKDNFSSIIQINLPKVAINYSFFENIKLSWRLSNSDFKFLVRNWTFYILLAFAFLFTLIAISVSGIIYGTNTYPVTWQMLNSMSAMYGLFLMIMILLFSGMLIQRSRQANMDLLVDATATPNWVLLLSKIIALFKLVLLVQTLCMLNGIIYQAYKGFYHFEIGHYFYELYFLQGLGYLYLILMAFFIHNFFKNYFIGFILCLFVVIGSPFLPKVGVEQLIFIPDGDPGFRYSDMNGYGDIRHFLYYRLYWIFFGLFLFGLTLLFWRRGIISKAAERVQTAIKRSKPVVVIPTILALLGFISLGYAIYYDTNKIEPRYTEKEIELQHVDYEKKYKKFSQLLVPRLTDVKVNVDIDPKGRSLFADGNFVYTNKGAKAIDTIFINFPDGYETDVQFPVNAKKILDDDVLKVSLYKLGSALQPGQSMTLTYRLKSKANTFLRDRSGILANGTFLNNMIFPSLAYMESVELIDNKVREKYGLPVKAIMADPRDSSKLVNNYLSQDADWINFEAIVSTSPDQIAIAPGYFQKEWIKDGKRYFHYKMDSPILNFYSFISAKYDVKKEQYKGKSLEIYYHPSHTYNLDRMMASMKKSLDYYETNYSPYQFHQMRIIEFPKTMGSFAQAFANTVPFSESIGFIAEVKDEQKDAVDYPYSVVAHEFAHQWWAHQVIGANVKGSTMMSESLAEYSSLKVLEHTYGKEQTRKYLQDALDNYLMGRAGERFNENPLMYNENQGYIHYNKGSFVMYNMAEYLGEQPFNDFLKEYIKEKSFQNPPYTTSIEFVDLLKTKVPDSLSYLIKDLFETVTLYDNTLVNSKVTPLKNGKYEVEMEFNIAKYRTDALGKKIYEDIAETKLLYMQAKDSIFSLPLQDYIEVGVFAAKKDMNSKSIEEASTSHSFENKEVVGLKRLKIDKINNKVKLIVDRKPIEISVDPYVKLIDTNTEDNTKIL